MLYFHPVSHNQSNQHTMHFHWIFLPFFLICKNVLNHTLVVHKHCAAAAAVGIGCNQLLQQTPLHGKTRAWALFFLLHMPYGNVLIQTLWPWYCALKGALHTVKLLQSALHDWTLSFQIILCENVLIQTLLLYQYCALMGHFTQAACSGVRCMAILMLEALP